MVVTPYLPKRLDTITGSTFVPIAHVLLDNAGATYVTGGTTDSTVVSTDGSPVTIVNNSASDALVAATARQATRSRA